MRGLGLAIAPALVALQLAVPAGAVAAWHEPSGSALNSGGSGYGPSLTPVAGVPHVAWDGDGIIRVRRLDSSGTGWEEVGDPFGDAMAYDPSLASVGGVPHVAWTEADGGGEQRIRVSRLDDDGTGWEEVGGALNHADPVPGPSPHGTTFSPNLAEVGGVPHVAWGEYDGTTPKIRVSRLNADGSAWEELGGGSTPINHSADGRAFDPKLVDIDGVPYVAWIEDDGTNQEVRVSRFNADASAWEEVVGGPSPINRAPDVGASGASLAQVDGVPYVAWTEWDGTTNGIQVSRLNAAGTGWEPVGGSSRINHASDQTAARPSLTAIDGVPYVAWNEYDGTNQEIRVSRLSAAGTAWVEVVGGASPINHSSGRHGEEASLVSVGGVPYVAWFEQGNVHYEVHVSRLEPEFLAQIEVPAFDGALLLSTVRTYGVAHPLAFEYGEGDSLDERTATTRTTYGPQEDLVVQRIDGLDPATVYSWRTIGFDGFAPTATAPTRTFVTLPLPPVDLPPTDLPQPPPTPEDAAPADPLLVAVLDPRLRRVAGRSVAVRYVLSTAATVSLEVRRCGGKVVARIAGAGASVAAGAGSNKIVWNGRIKGARPRPGCYILSVRAADTSGAVATDLAKLRLERRSVRRR